MDRTMNPFCVPAVRRLRTIAIQAGLEAVDFGAKGVGESPNVGSPAAFVNAVVDARSHLGVRHIDMPITPWKVWNILQQKGPTS